MMSGYHPNTYYVMSFMSTTSLCPSQYKYKLSIDEECEYTVDFFSSIVTGPTITLSSFIHTKPTGDNHLHYDLVRNSRRVGGGCTTLSPEESERFHHSPIKFVEDYMASFD